MQLQIGTKPSLRTGFAGLIALVGLSSFARAEVSEQALSLLEDRCASCHDGQSHPLDTLDIAGMTKDRGDDRDRFIHPGRPDSSYLMRLIDTDVMPKDGKPLSAEEKKTIRDWIESGATFPAYGNGPRKFTSEADVLEAIRTHLLGVRAEDRPFVKYFSIHTLANNRALPDAKIRLGAAALAKAVNSVSRKRQIIELEPIGDGNLVFAIDLKELGRKCLREMAACSR